MLAGEYRFNPENGVLPQTVMGLPLLAHDIKMPPPNEVMYADVWGLGDKILHHLVLPYFRAYSQSLSSTPVSSAQRLRIFFAGHRATTPTRFCSVDGEPLRSWAVDQSSWHTSWRALCTAPRRPASSPRSSRASVTARTYASARTAMFKGNAGGAVRLLRWVWLRNPSLHSNLCHGGFFQWAGPSMLANSPVLASDATAAFLFPLALMAFW